MKFGPVPVSEAAGAIAAHSVRVGAVAIRKGRLLTKEDAARLAEAGQTEITAVRLEPGDVGEDEAAHRIARAVAGAAVRVEKPFTGRSNLFAEAPGILVLDVGRIDALNAADEAITLATLPAYRPVVEGEMIGTVKIIPYAVPEGAVAAALDHARGRPLVEVAPYRVRRVAAISTATPGLKPTVIAKTLDALRARLAPAGAEIVADATVPHEASPLAEALARMAEGAELVVVFGASAIADRRDVIPAALEAANGAVEHLGMPVDPGNLLLVGRLGDVPVIGAPGCARSPKENGFDWVLQRLLAGLPVGRADITRLGVGGLLMEVVQRGQPRAGGESADPDRPGPEADR